MSPRRWLALLVAGTFGFACGSNGDSDALSRAIDDARAIRSEVGEAQATIAQVDQLSERAADIEEGIDYEAIGELAEIERPFGATAWSERRRDLLSSAATEALFEYQRVMSELFERLTPFTAWTLRREMQVELDADIAANGRPLGCVLGLVNDQVVCHLTAVVAEGPELTVHGRVIPRYDGQGMEAGTPVIVEVDPTSPIAENLDTPRARYIEQIAGIRALVARLAELETSVLDALERWLADVG